MTTNSSDLITLSLAGWKYWTALGETAKASGSVIAKRSAIIDHAMRNPFEGDVKELGRMLPEKMAAFARSGQSLFADMGKIQTLMLEHVRDIMTVTVRGKLATITDFERLTARAMTIVSVMTHSGASALQPVHATVTANDRRLK
jgi:hypothetical protein